MAKVTLTIEDIDGGGVMVHGITDPMPPDDWKEEDLTRAQRFGSQILAAVAEWIDELGGQAREE